MNKTIKKKGNKAQTEAPLLLVEQQDEKQNELPEILRFGQCEECKMENEEHDQSCSHYPNYDPDEGFAQPSSSASSSSSSSTMSSGEDSSNTPNQDDEAVRNAVCEPIVPNQDDEAVRNAVCEPIMAESEQAMSNITDSLESCETLCKAAMISVLKFKAACRNLRLKHGNLVNIIRSFDVEICDSDEQTAQMLTERREQLEDWLSTQIHHIHDVQWRSSLFNERVFNRQKLTYDPNVDRAQLLNAEPPTPTYSVSKVKTYANTPTQKAEVDTDNKTEVEENEQPTPSEQEEPPSFTDERVFTDEEDDFLTPSANSKIELHTNSRCKNRYLCRIAIRNVQSSYKTRSCAFAHSAWEKEYFSYMPYKIYAEAKMNKAHDGIHDQHLKARQDLRAIREMVKREQASKRELYKQIEKGKQPRPAPLKRKAKVQSTPGAPKSLKKA